jgi:hypothetical protein
MQMASSRADCFRGPANGSLDGFFDFLDPGTWFSSPPADVFPSSINVTPQVTMADLSFPSSINVTPENAGLLAQQLQPTGVTADAGPSFWSQLPGILTTGLQTYATVQAIQNPNSPMARALLPAGVTPSKAAYPPGTTFDQYGRAMLPGTTPTNIFSNPVILAALIGAGGLLMVAMMSKR